MYIYSPTTLGTRHFLTITFQHNILNSMSLLLLIAPPLARTCAWHCLTACVSVGGQNYINHWCVRGSLFNWRLNFFFFKYPRVRKPGLSQEKTTASTPKIRIPKHEVQALNCTLKLASHIFFSTFYITIPC